MTLGGPNIAALLSSNSIIYTILSPSPLQSIRAENTGSSKSAVLKQKNCGPSGRFYRCCCGSNLPTPRGKPEALCVQKALCTCTYPCLIRFLQGRCWLAMYRYVLYTVTVRIMKRGSARHVACLAHTEYPGDRNASEMPKLVNFVKYVQNAWEIGQCVKRHPSPPPRSLPSR